jgi:hypothetical protein
MSNVWKLAALAALVAPAIAGAQEASQRPNYKNVETKNAPPAGRQMYKTVDEKGRVVYTDAPKEAGQKAAKLNTSVNVATPESRRQLEIDNQNRAREEYAEKAAAYRRAAPIRQREMEEAAAKRREAEIQNPEYAPRPIRVVR